VESERWRGSTLAWFESRPVHSQPLPEETHQRVEAKRNT